MAEPGWFSLPLGIACESVKGVTMVKSEEGILFTGKMDLNMMEVLSNRKFKLPFSSRNCNAFHHVL